MLLEDMFANTNRRSWKVIPLAWLQSPGFAVITSWRLASRLDKGGVLSRVGAILIWRYFVASRGCYISLKANIGRRCRLPHPVGIAIGDGAIIGDDVTIYHNVTLGRVSSQGLDYPVVHNGVEIYAGSMLAGGITIGQRSVIGANSVVLTDVPPNSIAVGAPARILAAKKP